VKVEPTEFSRVLTFYRAQAIKTEEEDKVLGEKKNET
jgi:hypothetical protein